MQDLCLSRTTSHIGSEASNAREHKHLCLSRTTAVMLGAHHRMQESINTCVYPVLVIRGVQHRMQERVNTCVYPVLL